MKTIVLTQPGQFELIDTASPTEPGPDEAVVRVRRVGICGSDVSAYKGKHAFLKYPRILGHELGVEIVAVGPNEQGLAVGDRCAVLAYLSCGHCLPCRRGKTNCCVELAYFGVHMDGGLREFLRVPLKNLYKSAHIPLDQLALVEMLTIGAHAVSRAQLEVGEVVLVIGAGPIGLSVIEFACQAGVRVIVLEVNQQRLAFCRQHLPVDHYLDGSTEVIPHLQALLHGDLPTTVFDATGNVTSMHQALNYASHGGKVIYVGIVREQICFNDVDFHHRELTIMSSRNSTGEDYARTINLLETGRLDISRWITHRASLEGMIDAFPRWLEPESGVVKAVVEV
ncbi:MAG: zinc-binding alcohol dehydrogenase family protein [Anaerolineae bacterium]